MASIEELQIDPNLPDGATVAVCAKHLREMGLTKEADGAGDHKPCEVTVGKVRKALAATLAKKPAPKAEDK